MALVIDVGAGGTWNVIHAEDDASPSENKRIERSRKSMSNAAQWHDWYWLRRLTIGLGKNRPYDPNIPQSDWEDRCGQESGPEVQSVSGRLGVFGRGPKV